MCICGQRIKILQILGNFFIAEYYQATVADLPPVAVAEDTLGNQPEAGMRDTQRARAGIVRDMVLDIQVRQQVGIQGQRKGCIPQA